MTVVPVSAPSCPARSALRNSFAGNPSEWDWELKLGIEPIMCEARMLRSPADSYRNGHTDNLRCL